MDQQTKELIENNINTRLMERDNFVPTLPNIK